AFGARTPRGLRGRRPAPRAAARRAASCPSRNANPSRCRRQAWCGWRSWPSPVAKTYSSGPTPRRIAMDRKLLDILVCPATRQSLALLEPAGLDALNRAIASGALRRGDQSPQAEPLREALVTRDRRTVYRIDDGIP